MICLIIEWIKSKPEGFKKFPSSQRAIAGIAVNLSHQFDTIQHNPDFHE